MNKKKIIRNVIFVLAILILMIVLVVNLGDIKKIWHYISQTNYLIVLLAIGILLLYAVINQLSLISLAKFRYKEIKYVDCYCITGSEYFFNAITPFSSGGQPFEAYAFKRKGMPLSNSTSILLINFIAYQVILNVISVVFMIFFYGRVKEQIHSFVWLLLLGFSINALIMVGLVSIGISKTTRKFFLKLFDLICKIKPLRRFQKKHDNIEKYMENMQLAFKEIVKSPKQMIWVTFTKICSFAIYYSIPFFALWAVNAKMGISDLPYIMALTSFTLTIATWVPTPGGAGGIEVAFTLLYTPLLSSPSYGWTDDEAKSICVAVVVIWRLLTYYLLILYGLILYLLFEKRDKPQLNVVSENMVEDNFTNNVDVVSEEESLETK